MLEKLKVRRFWYRMMKKEEHNKNECVCVCDVRTCRKKRE